MTLSAIISPVASTGLELKGERASEQPSAISFTKRTLPPLQGRVRVVDSHFESTGYVLVRRSIIPQVVTNLHTPFPTSTHTPDWKQRALYSYLQTHATVYCAVCTRTRTTRSVTLDLRTPTRHGLVGWRGRFASLHFTVLVWRRVQVVSSRDVRECGDLQPSDPSIHV